MTDARNSREHVEALVATTPTEQLAREHVEALVLPTSTEQLVRLHIEVLIEQPPSFTGRWSFVT